VRVSRRRWIAGAGALIVAACSADSDLAEGESGRIVQVSDGDMLVLDGGLRVRLAEVEAPAPGYDGRVDQTFAAEASALLAAAATGRDAALWYGGLTRDRYERAIAHVIARDEVGRDVWLNGLMVREGGARVRTWPDNSRRARRLYALEAEARGEKRGLWALDEYRIRTVGDLAAPPVFAILEGRLLDVTEGAEDAVLIGRDGLRLVVSARLGAPDARLDISVGRTIRVRGRIDDRGEAPRMALTHWAQVEMG
jgi:micrococcal nuclease